jgi:hypothetical protein
VAEGEKTRRRVVELVETGWGVAEGEKTGRRVVELEETDWGVAEPEESKWDVAEFSGGQSYSYKVTSLRN